jgi:hypothetical protein
METAHQVLKYLDPKLGQHGSGAILNCATFAFDSFGSRAATYIVLEWVRWWFKVMLLRDLRLCVALGLASEALQLTFQPWLQDWRSCGWQYAIVDVILGKAIGAALGYACCKYLERRAPNWVEAKTPTSDSWLHGLERLFVLFHPNVWSNYSWNPLGSASSLFGVTCILVINCVSDLNVGLLAHTLSIPGDHWTLPTRTLILAFLSMISIKEYYEYLRSK